LNIFVVHVCQLVQTNVPELWHQETVTQAVLSTMMFVGFATHLHHHHLIPFAPLDALLLLPLETVIQAVISLLTSAVSASQLVPENVRMPLAPENVILAVTPTLISVENASLFTSPLHHPQQHVLHHHLVQLHLSVQLGAKMP